MGYYKPNSYKAKSYNAKSHNARHYTPRGNRNQGGSRRSTHPDHAVRNSLYGALACVLVLGFAVMWWGLAASNVLAIIVGIAAGVFAAASSVVTHIRCLIKYKRYKERHYYV